MKPKMKNTRCTKSILFVLGFVCVFSARYSATEDKHVISTIKDSCADFTYRILPADEQKLYRIEAEDAEINKGLLIESTNNTIEVK